MVEFVRPPGGGNYGVRFRYLNESGVETSVQSQIDRVEISLQIMVDDGTQNLTTEAELRNPG